MPSRRPEKTSSASWTVVLASVGSSLAVGKRTNWENSLTSAESVATSRTIRRGAFLSDAQRVRDPARLLGCAGAEFEVMQNALRGKLDGRERILDFVGDAAGHFLPRGGFLRAQHFGEVVEHEHKAGIGAARAQGADGDGQVRARGR